jgi:hypothetical protein
MELGFHRNQTDEYAHVVKMDIQAERGDRDMCCDLLRKKNLRGKGFFGSNHRGASQF